MLNRGLKIFAILIVLTIIGAVYFMTRKTTAKQIHPLSVFNDSAEYVIRINKPQQFFQPMETQPVCAYFKTFFTDTTAMPGLIPGRLFEQASEIYTAYHPSDGFLWMLSFPDDEKAENWVTDFVNSISNKFKVKQSKEFGNNMFSVETGQVYPIGLTQNSRVVIFANTELGCKQLIERIVSADFEDISIQSKIMLTDKLSSRESPANIFVNFPKKTVKEFPYISNNGWAVFDLWIKNQSLRINGLSSGDTMLGYLQVVAGQTCGITSADKIIPANTTEFYNLLYQKQLPLFADVNESYKRKFKKSYEIGLDEFFERIFGGEIIKFTTADKQTIVAIKVKGESTTEFNLKNMVSAASKQLLEVGETK